MPTECSTALPAMATMTRPVKPCERPSAVVAGLRAPVNQSETRAAATPEAPSRARVVQSGQAGSASSSLLLRGDPLAVAQRRGDAGREHRQQDDRADRRQDRLVLRRGRVQDGGERGQGQRGDREHEERRDHPRRLGPEGERPAAEAADQERQAQHQEAVGEDRADQRVADERVEALAQGEDRDQQLGQVAERRLDDAAGPGADVPAELVGGLADHPGQEGQRQGAGDEGRDGTDLQEVERARRDGRGQRRGEQEELAAARHAPQAAAARVGISAQWSRSSSTSGR